MRRAVIIGASAAGAAAAEAARRLDNECSITLISDEPVPLYSRCLLSDYFLGQVGGGRLTFQPKDWPRRLDLEVLQERATALDLAAGRVITQSDRQVAYDRLVLATGALPLMPAARGLEVDGVVPLYRLDQVTAALGALARSRRVVIQGAGKVGIKAAEAVAARQVPVTLVEQGPHVLPGMLDSAAAAWLEELLTGWGVQLVTRATVVEVVSRNGRVAGVGLDSGQHVSCDLFLVAIGACPNATLAKTAGIEVREGIVVDESMQTSAEGVYAAGDVAEAPLSASERHGVGPSPPKSVVGNWLNAVQQGRVAGRNLAGRRVAYSGSVRANAFRLAGLPVISVGEVEGAERQSWGQLDRGAQVYRRLVFRDGRLTGIIQVGGDVADVGILSTCIKSGTDVAGLQEPLFASGFSLFGWQQGRRLLAGQSSPQRMARVRQ
jgi:NAD(P)H-nitrite reductase large subunit